MTADIRDLRVLVVEDDYLIATDARRELERAGAQVIGPFGRAAQALEALEQQPIDCAVVDVNLGDGPSFEVAQALIGRKAPLVFVTGYNAEVLPDRYRGLTRLEKPVAGADLVAAVAEACGR